MNTLGLRAAAGGTVYVGTSLSADVDVALSASVGQITSANVVSDALQADVPGSISADASARLLEANLCQ